MHAALVDSMGVTLSGLPRPHSEADSAHYIVAVEPDYYLEVVGLLPRNLPKNVQIMRADLRCEYGGGALGRGVPTCC